MKTLAIMILLCAPLYGGDTTTTNIVGDITTTVSERSGPDGRPYLRIETVYRGKSKILQITSRRNQQGTMLVASRAYLANGKLLMTECDDNGDGFFESLAIFEPATDDLEMFIRQPDGSVKPVSTQTLQASKKQNAAVSEFWGQAFQQKELTDEKIDQLFGEMRKKILDAEQEKGPGSTP